MTVPRLSRRTSCRIAAAAIAITCGFSAALPRVQAQPALPPAPMPDAPPAPGDDEVEVLTRGPVHEAFAEQFNTDPQPGLTVPKEPPADVEEMVPETIPEGVNVQWIKGYWGWDDETENFLWISGFWRDIPAGQRWIPGYWHHVAAGYQWVSGFWITEQVAELDYLPQPPASLEVGPSTPSPSDNHFWVPGCWMYVGATYHWRPGFWSPCYDEWVWVPDRYIWTPFGFVYRPGYYDRLLSARGCLFAPVRFAHVHYWHGPRVFFTPTYVIDTGPLALHLFVRPTYCHYYFGDFYAAQYSSWGFRPWYTCDFRYRSTYCYDPLLVFYVGYHRRHGRIDYCDRLASWNRHYRDHADHRPPRTAREFDRFVASHGHDRDQDFVKNAALGRKLDDVVKEPRGDRKFRAITAVERTEKVKVASSSRELARMRKELESDGDGGGRRSRLPAGQIQTEHGVSAGPNVADRSGSERESKSRKLKLPKSESGTMGHAIEPRSRLPETPGGSVTNKGSKGDKQEPGGGNTAADSGRSRRTTVTPRGGGRNQSDNPAPDIGAPTIGGNPREGGNPPDGGKKDKQDDKEKGSSRNAPTPRIVPRTIESPPGGGSSNQGSSGFSPRRGSSGSASGGGGSNDPGNFGQPRIETKRGGNPPGSGSGSSGSGGSSSGSGKKEKRSGSSGASGAMSSGSNGPGSFGSIQKGNSRSSQSATSGSSNSRSSRSSSGSASRGGNSGTSAAMSSGRSGSSQNGSIRSSQSPKSGSSASSSRSGRSSGGSASRGGSSSGSGGSSDSGSKKKKDR